MSHQEVEVAKRAIGAFNRSDIDAFAGLTTPDFEWSPSMVAIEGEIFQGREGIEKYFGSLTEAWERFHVFGDGFRDSADLVIMLGRLSGLGKGSGVPVVASLGMVFDFRAGTISRIRGYLDHREALRDAGLSEPARSFADSRLARSAGAHRVSLDTPGPDDEEARVRSWPRGRFDVG